MIVHNLMIRLSHVPSLAIMQAVAKSTYSLSSINNHQHQLKTMNLSDNHIFQCIMKTPGIQVLKSISDKHKMEVRMAGGAVRDIILKKSPDDIDFATTFTPEEMQEVFKKEEIRMLEYGQRAIEHGTVTARIHDENYEITTTRSDQTCHGRHASVLFHRDWCEDASRRDLTFNAMFIDLDGILYDYHCGYEDLLNHRVRFVGDAEARIGEDYLRIMRYFRMYGKISPRPNEHCPEILSTIQATCSGLQGVAGERIWVELRKIISGKLCGDQIEHIVKLGIGPHIGLPSGCDGCKFTKLHSEIEHLHPAEVTLLSSLLQTDEEVEVLHKRLKLSKMELTTLRYIVKNKHDYKPGNVKFYQDCIIDSKERKFTHANCVELAKYCNDEKAAEMLSSWTIPKFPFSGKIFLDKGVPKGPMMAKAVNRVKDLWKETNFTLTKEQLELKAEKILREMEDSYITDPKKTKLNCVKTEDGFPS